MSGYKPLQKQLYAALQAQFPGESDKYIATQIGVGHSMVSKLKHSKGVGLPAARWLADNRKGYKQLYHDLRTQSIEIRRKGFERRSETLNQVHTLDITKLPKGLQLFCGYVGQ